MFSRETVRQTKQGLYLPIVGVTAHIDDDLRAQTQAACLGEILLKPTELQTLKQVFNAYHKIDNDDHTET